MESWADGQGAAAIEFNVSARNTAAQAFYGALGYERSMETRQKRLRTVVRLERPEAG